MQKYDYPYRLKVWPVAGALLICAALVIAMIPMASKNKSGLIINGIFRFSPHNATILLWVLTVGLGLTVILGGVALVLSLSREHRIVVGDESISVPKYVYSRTPTVILFSQIQRLSLQAVRNQRFLLIKYMGGKITLMESCFPSKTAFEALCSELAKNVPRTG